MLYIAIHKGKEEEFIEIAPGINVELDEDGKVCGIEIFQTSSETTLPPTGISWF